MPPPTVPQPTRATPHDSLRRDDQLPSGIDQVGILDQLLVAFPDLRPIPGRSKNIFVFGDPPQTIAALGNETHGVDFVDSHGEVGVNEFLGLQKDSLAKVRSPALKAATPWAHWSLASSRYVTRCLSAKTTVEPSAGIRTETGFG